MLTTEQVHYLSFYLTGEYDMSISVRSVKDVENKKLSLIWEDLVDYTDSNIKPLDRFIIPGSSSRDGTTRSDAQVEVICKIRMLWDMFGGATTEQIHRFFASEAGKLCKSIFLSVKLGDYSTPVRMLIDELLEQWRCSGDGELYVSRKDMMRELIDILNTKSITGYRKQRINQCLKCACIQCLGMGEIAKLTGSLKGGIGSRTYDRPGGRYIPDMEKCPTCNGTGTNPGYVITIEGVKNTKVVVPPTNPENEDMIDNETKPTYNADDI